jgi:NADH-quinone oxidoreductase subunit N
MTPTPALNLQALAPISFPAIASMIVLLGEVILSRRKTILGSPTTPARVGIVLAGIACASLVLSLLVAAQSFLAGMQIVFDPESPMLRLDRLASFAIAVIALSSLLACLLSVHYLDEVRIHHGEYYALLLLATTGMMLLVASVDLVMAFLGIELMSIPIYVLAGFQRKNLPSNESALKYFLVGSFASAILLYGMALLYGTTGTTDFAKIREGFEPGNAIAMGGLALVVVGLAFKVSSVPFHQWTPDVYEGAPAAVTAYMSVTVKTAAFVALLRFVTEAIGPAGAGASLTDVFGVLAALTMIVGNVMAVIQSSVKRMLAYSSVAHAGYLLIGFATATSDAYAAVLFYLLVYVLMNLGAFAVVVVLAKQGEDKDSFEDFAGLAKTRPGLAVLMTLFLLSLAGIPGTAGFIGKFVLFGAAVKDGLVPLTILAVLASLVSVYYYLRLPVVMWMRDSAEGQEPGDDTLTLEGLVLAVCAVLVVFLGLFPNWAPRLMGGMGLLEWARQSVAMLQ